MDKKGKIFTNSYWVDVLHQPMSTSTSFAPPSFPIGLVKTESDFIVRSVEAGLERWKLVVAVISVDAYPFLVFSYLTCHLEDMGIGDRYRCFLVALCPLMVRRPNLEGSSNQEASPSAGRNPGVVLVPCSLMEVHSYSYFWWCGYFWGLWVSFVMTYDQWGSQKLLCPLMVRRPNLEGSSDQEASPSAGKNPGVVLVPCSLMEVHSYSYFWWCGYFWGLWVSFVMTDDQWGSQKLLQQLVSHELTAYLSIFNLFELN